MTVVRDKRTITVIVQPVDLSNRLKTIKQERQQQLIQERIRSQEYGPFRATPDKVLQ